MEAKKIAATKAVEYVRDGMLVGLGTGSTAYWAIQKLGEKVRNGLQIAAVATSKETERLAIEAGISLVPFSSVSAIDIAIDGADETDRQGNLIKGGGGALLREKIIAFNSKEFIVIVDESKLSERLGSFALPVEIVPFAHNLTINKLQELGCKSDVRTLDGKNYITDNGNLIVDCQFSEIVNPEQLNSVIHLIPGVVETGLFLKSMVAQIIVGYNNGKVEEIKIE